MISDDEASKQIVLLLNALERSGSPPYAANHNDSHTSNSGANPCSKSCVGSEKKYGDVGNNLQELCKEECNSNGAFEISSIKSMSVPKPLRWKNAEEVHRKNLSMDFVAVARKNLDIMYNELGYVVERRESDIVGGGRGVKVICGQVPKNRVVAMYPGKLLCSFFCSKDVTTLFQTIGKPKLSGNGTEWCPRHCYSGLEKCSSNPRPKWCCPKRNFLFPVLV
jgi:hypothetical protein